MLPYLPSEPERFDHLGPALFMGTGCVGAGLANAVQAELKQLLYVAEGYYSLLLDADRVPPQAFWQALLTSTSEQSKPLDADLQKASERIIAYAQSLQAIDETLAAADDSLNVSSATFIMDLHRRYYEILPPEQRKTRQSAPVAPGIFRPEPVTMRGRTSDEFPGAHELIDLLDVFAAQYRARLGHDIWVRLASAHHRLLWIRPFTSGNGQMTRLWLYAALRQSRLFGPLPWCPSRAFAHDKIGYLRTLQTADAPRRSTYDGDGLLTDTGLREHCRFVLEHFLAEIRWSQTQLNPEYLSHRMEELVAHWIAQGLVRPQAQALLTTLLFRGGIRRGDVAGLCDLKERNARYLISDLLRLGILKSPSPKGPLHLGLRLAEVVYLLPGFLPTEVELAAPRHLPPTKS